MSSTICRCLDETELTNPLDDDWLEEEEEEEEEEECFCLVCDTQNTFKRICEHLKAVHGEDIVKRCKEMKFDLASFIKFVNFCRIRSQTLDKDAAKTYPFLQLLGDESDETKLRLAIEDEKYLIPVIKNDQFLSAPIQLDEEELCSDCEEEKDDKTTILKLQKRIVELEKAHNEFVKEAQIKLYGETIAEEDENDSLLKRKSLSDSDSDSEIECDGYFASYSGIGIHDDMLKDNARTGAYYDYITKNSHLFRDKIVLDVGTGTGILSLFAVKAGAKKVYAVEASNIAKLAARNIKANHCEDKIELIRGKVEQIELPEGTVVDCIVSEWMGYFLVFENMLDSVLFARDKWLRKSSDHVGVMAPSHAQIFLGVLSSEERYNDLTKFYLDVNGIDMSPTLDVLLHDAIVSTIYENEVLDCSPKFCVIKSMDLNTIGRNELKCICNDFSFTVKSETHIHGFVGCFDTTFQGETIIRLGTLPNDVQTHWHQTLLYLDEPLLVKSGDIISGKIAISQTKGNNRSLTIDLSFNTSSHENVIKKMYFLQ